MKRQKFITGLTAVALCGLVLSACTASAQKAQPAKVQVAAKLEAHGLDAREMERAKVSVARPSSNRMNLVIEQFNGSFNDVESHLNSFKKEFMVQGHDKNLKSDPPAILIIYEDPTGKASFRMAVGLELPAKVEVKPPLKAEVINEPQVAHYTHVGAYERLKNVHDGIEEHARANKKATRWPVILRLLSDPKKVPPGQLKTEVLIPL